MEQRKKNIAFLHQDFPGGGTEMVTMNIAKLLGELNVFVFATNFYDEKRPSGLINIEPIKLPYVFYDTKNLPTIVKNIKEKDIDFFVFPGGCNDVVCLADAIREETDCKIIYMSHFEPFWEYIEDREIKKRRAKGSFIKTLEWNIFRSHKYRFGIRKAIYKEIYKACYDKVDIFGVLCEEYGREIAKEIGVKYEGSKFRVLNNSIELNDTHVTPKKKEVCFVGRLSYWDKRPENILKVWSLVEDKHPDWILNILGTGAEEENLKRLAENLNLKRVRFLGFVSNVQSYYDRASIVCMTSDYEGWGMVLMEAQINGCVAMAFDCSAGVREILSPSWKNGVLIRMNSIKTYAKALSKLMSDSELRERIAENGRVAVQRFSPENTLLQWKGILKELSR
ncbi:MAG: glycosyltransferase [Muribaculaceae bacterium]|nr:glycosyltransferase [Muribaculaceae bacterium]